MDFANNFSTEHLQLDTSGLLKQHALRNCDSDCYKCYPKEVILNGKK